MHLTPKTQKAQGIMALKDCYGIFGLKGPGRTLMVIPGSLFDCRMEKIKFPVFARPCPFEPRHGFVDSHLVYDWPGVIRMLQIATDEGNGKPVEIVLTPPLSGVVSAVATNAGVTWGYGNDGVTAGSDKHPITIPVNVPKTLWREALGPLLSSQSNFDMPDCPYLEIVEDKGKMRIVQIRGGPEQPEGFNHVVRKVKVRKVLLADQCTNLLSWERVVTSHKSMVGTVIYAPGMSLSAHCCVHGIENGIPVITDHAPKLDDVIAATKNKVPALTKREYKKLAIMVMANLTTTTKIEGQDAQKHALTTSIATIQAQFCWGKQNHLLLLRSLAVVLLLKAVLASCCGEIRHWNNERHGFNASENTPEITYHTSGLRILGNVRESIYNNIINHSRSLPVMMTMLKAAKKDLSDVSWNRSFGGLPWAAVAATGIALNKALEMFLKAPCSKTWSRVIQRANRLINTSHNTGKCLTKWVEQYTMEAISQSPTVGFLNSYTAFVALGMNTKGQDS